jgi:hypothetical protein
MKAIGCVDGFDSTPELLAIFQIIMHKRSVVDDLDAGGNGHRILRRKPKGTSCGECKPGTNTLTSRGEMIGRGAS